MWYLCVKFQLSYFLKEQYDKTLTEVSNTKNSEGLSGSDKMMMNASKIDEGTVVLADLNIDLTTKRIMKQIDVPISEEEIDYYVSNHQVSKIQRDLVYAYYTKYFGSYRDLNLLSARQYMTLVILLKKKLLIELGYEEDVNGEVHCAALPYILTGNVSDKVNTRLIRNNRFIARVTSNEGYMDLIQNKYSMLGYLKPEYLLQELSSVINTRFTYVAYEYPELLGTEIYYNEDKISDELIFFLKSL